MTFLRASLLASFLVVACNGSHRSPGVPPGATAIDDESHRSCTCVLLHLTHSASPSRAIDRAKLAQMAGADPSLCAYELLADAPEVEHAKSDALRPYLLQAEGAPVDLAFAPGDRAAPAVVDLADDAQVRAACNAHS
jgi:hypothetical protein